MSNSLRRNPIDPGKWRWLFCIFFLSITLHHCGGAAPKTPEVGEQAWNFDLKSLGEESVSLQTLQRKGLVLVNFWATWCTPCKVELPALKTLHNAYRDKGLVVVGISVEERGDMVKRFCRKNGIDYTILLDSDAAVAKQYALVGYPATFILDRDGRVLYRTLHKLEAEDEEMIKAILDSHLGVDQS